MFDNCSGLNLIRKYIAWRLWWITTSQRKKHSIQKRARGKGSLFVWGSSRRVLLYHHLLTLVFTIKLQLSVHPKQTSSRRSHENLDSGLVVSIIIHHPHHPFTPYNYKLYDSRGIDIFFKKQQNRFTKCDDNSRLSFVLSLYTCVLQNGKGPLFVAYVASRRYYLLNIYIHVV